MRLSWKGPGIRDFIEELYQSSTETRRASKVVMRRKAKDIMEASKEGAPIDDGQLEQAHHISTIRLAKDNIDLEISVGGVVDGVDVDDYANEMHEGFYDLGLKSQAKQGSVGREVGRKFLERALDDHEDELIAAVTDTLPGR